MRNSIEVISYEGTAPPHLHEHTQIVLPLSGSLCLEVEKRQQAIQFGQACLISTHQAHTHLAEENNRCLVLNALPVWDQKIQSECNFIHLTPQAQAYLPFLSSLTTENATGLKTHQALNLLEHLLPIPQEKILHADIRLAKAKQRLDNDFQTSWSLTELAEEVHLSPSQLGVLFKRHFGMTPKQYLLKRRLEEAKIWLSSTNKSLDYIAYKVGLSSASVLIKLFSKHYHTSPGRYRKQHSS